MLIRFVGDYIGSLYLRQRLIAMLIGLIVVFVLGFFRSILYDLGLIACIVLGVLSVVDYVVLYRQKEGVKAVRITPERFSNGDENTIQIFLENHNGFQATFQVVDEMPVQFQVRDQSFELVLPPGTERKLSYQLRPVKRGEYHFGAVNVLVSSPIGLLSRRFRFSQDAMVATYPSFIHLRKYELLAISNQLQQVGIKKIRRIGHTMEFEQIKDYVPGDDIRTINWKATAKRAALMVNQYQDERSQNVYNILDMGRAMKMPFLGMTLLDYAINSSLILSKVALTKGDKAGVVAFSDQEQQVVPAGSRASQMYLIMERLYRLQTAFREPNFDLLYAKLRQVASQRSLVVFYTNFETLSALQRQLPYLRALAKNHLVLVVFFENTIVTRRQKREAHDVKEVYDKVIAAQFTHEKRLILREFRKAGIQAILTPPEQLTVNTVNRYLEIKARGIL